MEANFIELKMKLTKANMAKEFQNVVLALEDRDKTVNDLKGEILKLNKTIKELSSKDLLDENKSLQNSIGELFHKYQTVLNEYSYLMNIYENHLKVLQTTTDNQVTIFFAEKAKAEAKYGKKSE